jgi:hypothetical protein
MVDAMSATLPRYDRGFCDDGDKGEVAAVTPTAASTAAGAA